MLKALGEEALGCQRRALRGVPRACVQTGLREPGQKPPGAAHGGTCIPAGRRVGRPSMNHRLRLRGSRAQVFGVMAGLSQTLLTLQLSGSLAFWLPRSQSHQAGS